MWVSLQQLCNVANLWNTQNACRWPRCSAVAVQSATHPMMHGDPAAGWPQLLLCAGCLHVLVNISYSEVASDECGRKTMTSGCITFEMYLYCVSCVRLCCAKRVCVGGVRPWLDAVSYALSWGALDLLAAPAVKQQQPYREALICRYMFTILHCFNCMTRLSFEIERDTRAADDELKCQTNIEFIWYIVRPQEHEKFCFS